MDTVRTRQTLPLRPLALGALLAAEVLAISLGFDAWQPALRDGGAWVAWLAYAGQFAKMLVAVAVVAALGLWPRIPAYWNDLNRAPGAYRRGIPLAAHLACFALFAWLTAHIFTPGAAAGAVSGLLGAGWIAAMAATAGLWLLALAPVAFWRRLLARERWILAAALLVGLLAWALALYAQSLWSPLSELTFRVTAGLLGTIYPDVIVNPEYKQLGANGFVVNIAPQCSGYEGMGLMAIFTAFYLSVFRRDFRFPRALWLFPLGLATIWLFNSLRIALLVAIGISYSPAVAVGGFHSQAGWISFIAVIVLLLAAAYRLPYFTRARAAPAAREQRLNLPMALLIPFVVLLAATILTSAFSAGFDWLYPLRVVAVGLALAFCWRLYRFSRPRLDPVPWLAGVAVFALWLLLVPDDAQRSAAFEAELFAAAPGTAAAWLAFRLLGAVVTVPLAEELLFRGYLLARLGRTEVVTEGRIGFSWLALAVSSVLFGLLHSAWLAGIAAGLVYGWVRYRGDSVRDAILAHACTNLLLSLYVIASGSWSLW